MIDQAVCNLLIPFCFEMEDWEKLDDCREQPSKEIIEEIKGHSCFESKEWYSYCFKDLRVNETFQMRGSPLLCGRDGIQVKRMELNQPVRSMVGIHRNENALCSLAKEHIHFRIKKIRLLFYKLGLGMIHMEITGDNLSTDELLNLNEQLAAIQKNIKFSYENKIAKDSTETIVKSIKGIVERILSLQTYIHLKPCDKETFGKAYILEYLAGNIGQNGRSQFFEMLRNQRRSNMRAAAEAEACYLYQPFDYITWILGDKTLACYSDMSVCGDDNRKFLTEPGGLVKSIDLNYLTIYAYLIAVQLRLREAEVGKEKDRIDYLHGLPIEKLSAEVHMNELFDVYVNSNVWKLSRRISDIWNEYSLDDKLSGISLQVDQLTEDFSGRFLDLSEKTDYLVKQVDYIVSFTDKELRSFLDEERVKLKKSRDADPDVQVGEFINHTSAFIDKNVGCSGDEIIKKERESLCMLFGDRWQYLLGSSQTSLVSAGVLLKRCADINTPDFDFSGICICATAALEAELKRVFFDGLLDYMVNHYGTPGVDDANEIYKSWPDVLLTVPRFQFTREKRSKLRKVNRFTMGNLPFLFGETERLSAAPMIRTSQLAQAEMMKARMSEYLSTIIRECYKSAPYEAFYLRNSDQGRFACQPGCFVWKCERIRENYRNKAAHVNVMTEEEASLCYQSIITRPDTYVYNAEIAGAILELFSKIDGSKLQ